MPAKSKAASSKDSSANLGFEAKLWLTADSRSAAETAEGNLRNNMDAAEYKHVVLGCQPKQRNATTRRLAVMNLAIRSVEADFVEEHADTFRRDLHPDLRADFVIANPPFNDSNIAMRDSAFFRSEALPQVMTTRNDNFRKDDDVRWSRSEAETASHFSSSCRRNYGVPPKGNANFAWVQHFIHHLAPTGMAGFVIANGSLSSTTSPEKGRSAAPSSKPTSWTACSPSPASFSTAPRFPSASGSPRKTKAPIPNAVSATAANRPS